MKEMEREMSKEKKLTFFGGRMAMADLGVTEIWWGLEAWSFSPLRERRMAFNAG